MNVSFLRMVSLSVGFSLFLCAAFFAADLRAEDIIDIIPAEIAAATPDIAIQEVATAEIAEVTTPEISPPTNVDNVVVDNAVTEIAASETEKTESLKTAGTSAVETQAETKSNRGGYVTLSVFAAVLLISFGLARVLSKRWRVPELSFRMFVIFLCVFGSVSSVYLGWHRLALGIDLRGGVVLVYDVAPAQGQTNVDMDALAQAIGRRVNPGGVKEISITKLGENQLKVVIPEAEESEVARIERVISESGALTFRILASSLYPQDQPIATLALNEQGRQVRDAEGKLLAEWTPVSEKEREPFDSNNNIYKRERRGHLEVLVLYNDGCDVTGEFLRPGGVRRDFDKGQPVVAFGFNSLGSHKFGVLTGRNVPDPVQPNSIYRLLGIVLNDSLYSAPRIQSQINDNGQITFGQRHTVHEIKKLEQEIADLIDILNAGGLPAELSKEPVSRQLMGATLGDDTIRKGQNALTAAGMVVLLFMLFYYRFLGVIACCCVVLNLALILAVMLSVRAAFTLPGLAGLVLTVGMAVDANILIFERLREEIGGGASLRMAIRNAFARATTAIVDSNLTTLIIGLILYAVGTEQVKGFAVTLILGVLFSMFTAIYCSRTVLEVAERSRMIRRLSMMQMMQRTQIDFLSARNVCYAISLSVIFVGLVAVIGRGKGILDIDFVGGVSVEAIFTEPQRIDEIRAKLSKDLPDLAVSNLKMEAATMTQEAHDTGKTLGQNTHFIINTSIPAALTVTPEDYLRTVTEKLKSTFGDKLLYRAFRYQRTDAGADSVDAATDENSAASEEATPQEEAASPEATRQEISFALTVEPGMNREALESLIATEIKQMVATGKMMSDFSHSLTRDGILEGDRNSYGDWKLLVHAAPQQVISVLESIKNSCAATPYFPTSTTIGGQVASHTRASAMIALISSLVCIMFYIRFRFQKWMYGIAAVIALVHDVLVVLGLIALSSWWVAWFGAYTGFLQIEEFKIGLPVVAAFLTIIGYSLNDTIIIFDRIRENKGKAQNLTKKMINNSVNQTLARTILTSLTTLFVVVILYIWGGQGIHTFAFALMVGVIAGTYSTIYVASALLYALVGRDN